MDVAAGSGEPGAVGLDRVQLVFQRGGVLGWPDGEESAVGRQGGCLEACAQWRALLSALLVVEVLPHQVAAYIYLDQPGHEVHAVATQHQAAARLELRA